MDVEKSDSVSVTSSASNSVKNSVFEAAASMIGAYLANKLPDVNLDEERRNNSQSKSLLSESNTESNVKNSQTSNVRLAASSSDNIVYSKGQISYDNAILAKTDIQNFDCTLLETILNSNTTVMLVTSTDMPKGEEGLSASIVKNKFIGNGEAPVIESKLYLNMDKLYDPNKSPEYNRAKMLAAYVQGCYLLRLTTSSTRDELIENHQQFIAFLERVAEAYSNIFPRVSDAIREVKKEEEIEFNKFLQEQTITQELNGQVVGIQNK